MRSLTSFELELVTRLVGANPGASKMERDLPALFITEETADKARITFGIRGYKRPAYEGQRALPVEGRLRDRDGKELSALLYVDQEERLLELELIRWGHGPLLSPRWDTVQIAGSVDS